MKKAIKITKPVMLESKRKKMTLEAKLEEVSEIHYKKGKIIIVMKGADMLVKP